MSREGYPFKASLFYLFGIFQGAGYSAFGAEMRRSHTEKPVGVALLDLRKVRVLVAVDDLMNDYCGSYLGVVHIGKEDLSAVAGICHKGRKHLDLFVHKDAPSVLQGQDAFSVHIAVLLEPEVGMGVDDGRHKAMNLTSLLSSGLL